MKINWLQKFFLNYFTIDTPIAEPVKEVEPVKVITPDFEGITKYKNARDARAWPVTSMISNVKVKGQNVFWSEDTSRDLRWNEFSTKGKNCNGEIGIVIPSRGEAGMFDFLRKGQRNKIMSNLAEFFHGWTPVKGERVGFFIMTISRNHAAAKMQERSNVVWITWP